MIYLIIPVFFGILVSQIRATLNDYLRNREEALKYWDTEL
jgi:hypothetical protein